MTASVPIPSYPPLQAAPKKKMLNPNESFRGLATKVGTKLSQWMGKSGGEVIQVDPKEKVKMSKRKRN